MNNKNDEIIENFIKQIDNLGFKNKIFLNTSDTAKILGIPISTLKSWRKINYGIDYHLIGKNIFYNKKSIAQFLVKTQNQKINNMKLFDKYSENGTFTNQSLENMLRDLGLSEHLINEIIIRSSISSLTKEFIEKLKKTDEKENIFNIVLEYFLLADKMKPISCNKQTLSKLTGLSERQIDEKRRARQLPFIQLSGGNEAGRKIIVYDPIEVINYLHKDKVKVIA